MKIISYYTKGAYEKVMNENLKPSLDSLNLDYYIREVEDLGNWNANTSFKPTFIQDCLLEFEQDLIFSDADSVILTDPVLFDEIPLEYDIACHYLDWYKYWRGQKNKNKLELLSGTMMFRYNLKTITLLDEYKKQCKANPSTLEQKILQDILESGMFPIKVYNLPASYCAVVNYEGKIPSYIGEPIIIHNQASRDHRRKK